MSLSQTDKLEKLLLDYRPHRTDEIMITVYGGKHLGIARIGARINDLKKRGHNIPNAIRDKYHKTLFWYRIIPKEKRVTELKEPTELWYKKIFRFKCKKCGKDKETKKEERAVAGICVGCDREVNENQMSIYDKL